MWGDVYSGVGWCGAVWAVSGLRLCCAVCIVRRTVDWHAVVWYQVEREYIKVTIMLGWIDGCICLMNTHVEYIRVI